jgi:hypothetical protein
LDGLLSAAATASDKGGTSMRRIATAVVAAAAYLGLCLPAGANSPEFQAMRTNILLQKLIDGGQSTAKRAALTTRSAKIRLNGTINKKGSFTKPLFCSVSFYYYDDFNYFNESKSEAAEFDGTTGTCTVTVPFKWKVDNVANMVEVSAYVYNGQDGLLRAKAAGEEIGRSSDIDLPDIPLPAEGEVAVLTFDIDM